jgi:hypothetical protein
MPEAVAARWDVRIRSGRPIACGEGMRRALVVAAAIVVTGCASLRPLSPEAPRATAPVAAGETEHGGAGSALRYSVLGCIPSPEVDAWERRLAREEAQWRRMVGSSGRGGAFYRTVQRIVDEEGLPPGLALLPAIESGYRLSARGPTGARGLWQFGARTARSYGLVVNSRRDDRMNVELSTRAALRHLRNLRERYGTWPLALAAYNAGEGRVRRALGSQSGDTFWRLAKARQLPPVTRKYVPKFLALVRVLRDVDACPPVPPPSFVAVAE